MRQDIHPPSGPVVFRDVTTGDLLLTRSTLVSRHDLPTIEMEGEMLPVFDIEISSHSHPFWTGRSRIIDTEGRVEAFRRRYGVQS